MPIDTKDSYKYRNQVRVEVDSKTEEGKKLLDEYKRDQKYHYMDIGRVGRHLPDGKYYIEKPIIAELITIPKIIIQVREKAIDKAGKDVYELKTFLSRFGELDFYATIDYNRADLYFVEHVWVENLGIQENYSTLIYSIYYENQKVPMKEIFYKFNISANADDYGKRWKDIDITNTLIAKTKACLAVTCANAVAREINQAALEQSINIMEGSSNVGQKVVSTFNKAIKKDDDLKFKITKTPELTKTNLFLDAIDTVAGNKALKNINLGDSVNKVLDIQTDKVNAITADISMATTPLCICNKFTELQESSVATIENNLSGQMADSEMINDGLKTSKTAIQTMPDGSKKVVMMVEPTNPQVEMFDIKNENLVTQIRLMNTEFDDIMTIDGKLVDVSIERFNEESKKTRAYLVLQNMQADERFDIFATENEKEFKKKLKKMTVQEAEEMKRLRAQYREIFAAAYPVEAEVQNEIILQDLEASILQGQLVPESPTAVLREERVADPTEQKPAGQIFAEEQISEEQFSEERARLQTEMAELQAEETEEQKRKKRLAEQAMDLDAEREQEILDRQQEQAEELQEEVIEAQTNGEDVKEHLANIERQKVETESLQTQPIKQEDKEAFEVRDAILEEQNNQQLFDEKERELNDLITKQQQEEQERKAEQMRMQAELDAAQREAEDKLEALAPDPMEFSGLEQDNINTGGSEVFENEKSSSVAHQDNEGITVISDEPQKERGITLEL